MDVANQEIVSAARTEAARMAAAVAGKPGDDRVTMSVTQFSTLARLIATMGDRLAGPHPGSFGEARYWVPLDAFERNRRALQALEAECNELRNAALAERISLSAWS